MGMWILHDTEQQRAVIYDSCYERPLGPGFIGDDAQEQAEIFLAYAIRRLGLGLRGARPALEVTRSEWDYLHEDFVARALCVSCGDLAVDDSLRYSAEEIDRALDLLGVACHTSANDLVFDRLCRDCFDGTAREKHPGALGPVIDPDDEEAEEASP